MATKICTNCGIEKDVDEFNKHCRHKDGLQSQCKECKRKIDKIYRDNHKEENKKYQISYCLAHKQEKFEYDKKYIQDNYDYILKRNKEYRETHKEEVNKRIKECYDKNRSKYYDTIKKYRKTPRGRLVAAKIGHKRRALSKSTECTLTLEQWNKILKDHKNKCASCGEKFTKENPPTKDHIVPLSKNGGLTFENVQPLCLSCNCKKSNKLDKNLIITWISGVEING